MEARSKVKSNVRLSELFDLVSVRCNRCQQSCHYRRHCHLGMASGNVTGLENGDVRRNPSFPFVIDPEARQHPHADLDPYFDRDCVGYARFAPRG